MLEETSLRRKDSAPEPRVHLSREPAEVLTVLRSTKRVHKGHLRVRVQPRIVAPRMIVQRAEGAHHIRILDATRLLNATATTPSAVAR